MNGLIDMAVSRSRLVCVTLAVGLIAGWAAFSTAPKEADPDIPIPFIYVGIPLEGASPEDAERLVVRPLETQLRSLEGVQELNCTALLGYGQCTMEFDVSFDQDQALSDVRNKVDDARREFPAEVDEWTIQEANASLNPVLIVNLFGDAPERTLFRLARELEEELEAHPSILDANLSGAREEVLEVVVDPSRLDSYGITYSELVNAVSQNNRLVAAGALETGPGQFQIKVPGLFEDAQDVLELPLRSSGDAVVTLRDIAEVSRTFKDRESFATFNGQPTIALQVRKRLGANIIEVTDATREIAAEMAAQWPDTVNVAFSLDQSTWIDQSIAQLGASVGTAVLLVMIIVVAALGFRSGLLVGVAIPCSFMLSFLFITTLGGMSINMMVLFGMVLSVGMLVDGAIVVVEYADRKTAEGMASREAFALAGKRMFWPIISSTATTIAAFVPFLFWNSMEGQYMGFLPKTLMVVLICALLVALVFLPVIGGLVGRRAGSSSGADEDMKALSGQGGDPRKAKGITGGYVRFAEWTVHHPLIVCGTAVLVVVAIWAWFINTPHRVELFLSAEPEQVNVYVRARGNLSPAEMAMLGDEAQTRIQDIEGVKSIFMSAGGGGGGAGVSMGSAPPEDTVANLFVEFFPYGQRPNGRWIVSEIENRLADFPGVLVEVQPLEQGPPVGKDIQIELSSNDPEALDEASRTIRDQLRDTTGLTEIDDTLPLPGVEWVLRPDRQEAGRFGVDVTQIGAAVQLVTNGVLVGRYRPNDSEDELDIRVRFNETARDINQLDRLRVATPNGQVPISNFVERVPEPQVNRINRRDGRRYVELRANAQEGYAANLIVADLREWLPSANLDPAVQVRFRGADEGTADAGAFFITAMGAALFLMAAILLMQFNNFWHVYLTLQTVVLSVTGVLLGIQLTYDYVSVLMVGTGVVALAGIVVNNNIVLIDTFQRFSAMGYSAEEAVVRTASQRFRPVMLTTVTTIFGLLPMVFMINADFIAGRITFGGTSAEWWVPLASAVVWGLGFSTFLTLILTPALLAVPARIARALGFAVEPKEPHETRPQAANEDEPLPRAAE
ncbi:MAG: efflux RND transporter permease subunit [Maricaulaceae bacterium]|jgi:multidrug efflux pump